MQFSFVCFLVLLNFCSFFLPFLDRFFISFNFLALVNVNRLDEGGEMFGKPLTGWNGAQMKENTIVIVVQELAEVSRVFALLREKTPKYINDIKERLLRKK